MRCEADLASDMLDQFGIETQLRDNGDGIFEATIFIGSAGWRSPLRVRIKAGSLSENLLP